MLAVARSGTLRCQMAIKLSVRQQSQLAFLQLVPPKIARIKSVVEQMGGGAADETVLRGMIRQLDEMKAHASQLKINGLADAAANMAATGRRGGGQQVKVRALRECIASLNQNYDIAMRKASIPDPEAPEPEEAPPA